MVCLAAAILPLCLPRHDEAGGGHAIPPPWPEPFRSMQPLPLRESERAFDARFKGDGHDWLLRWIADASRRVHPVEECYRATGWRIRPRPALRASGHRWSCFEASRRTERVEICQTIVDGAGQSWGDSGSWWWSAILGRSRGPWLEVVMAGAGLR